MKIWITEIGEPLPLESNVRLHRYGEFSRFLAEQGHDVTWWSSSFSHAPKKHLSTQDTDFFHGKARVKLLHGPGYKKNISVQRIMHQKHFAKKFFEQAHKEESPNVVLTPIPTIDVAKTVNQYCRERSIPYFVDIRDLWPDEFKNLAPKPLRPIARGILHPLYLDMKKICSQAYGIMGVSKSYLEYGLKFARRVISPKDCLFPLGYSIQAADKQDIETATEFWRKLGLQADSFIISFIGTIGQFFNLETVLKTAEKLKNDSNIQFVLAGDGSRLERYRKSAQSLPNVIFPGWINAAQIKTLLEQSNIALAPYKADSAMALPNKPFEYMAFGLPIISSIQGELKDYLARYDVGLTYNANDSAGLTRHILFLYQNQMDLRQKGDNARILFSKFFDMQVVFKKMHEHLLKCHQIGFK